MRRLSLHERAKGRLFVGSLLALTAVLLLPPQAAHAFAPAQIDPEWTTQLTPFQIADHLYYVGSRDLAAYLITTSSGNILINSNLSTSPPQIRKSIEQLGFRWKDTRILLISHAHFDHAAGSAQILRETGAQFDVMDGDVDVMQSGGRTDFAFGPKPQFPAAHVSRVLHDGDTVQLGGVTLVAHKTAGHTRGCTTWTMKVHMPGDPSTTLRNVVIGGSWTVLSEYRLVPAHGKSASYPGIAQDYKATFALLQGLPCDLFLASHGSFFDLENKLKRQPQEGYRVWIDPAGYKTAVANGQQAFENVYQKQVATAARN